MKVLSSMGVLLRDLAYLVTQVVTWKLFAYLSRGGSSGWYVFVFIYIFKKYYIKIMIHAIACTPRKDKRVLLSLKIYQILKKIITDV